MKTAISVPDPTFVAVEDAAAKLGISRSEFYARAAQRWVDQLDDDGITAQINASLEGIDQAEDNAFVRTAATKSLARGEWLGHGLRSGPGDVEVHPGDPLTPIGDGHCLGGVHTDNLPAR